MQLSDDRSQATLSIERTVTAAQLEDLIRELAALRAQMTPEVRPAPQGGTDADSQVMLQNEPTLAFEHPARDPHVTMYLRSTGLGWTAWRLHPSTQQALAEFFYSRLPRTATGAVKAPIPSR